MVTTLNNVVPTLDLGRAITEAVRLPITAFDAGKTRIVVGLPPRAVVVGGQVIVRDIFNGTSPQVKVGYSNFTTDTDLTAYGTVPLTATGSTLIGPAASGGYPDATTTGPAAGTVFTTTTGDLVTTSNGQLIEKRQINNGLIDIRHANVTVRDCIINSQDAAAIRTTGVGPFAGCLIERCKITGIGGQGGITPDALTNVEIRFCDISGYENGIFIGDTGMNIHDNYIHGLMSVNASPHIDGIQGSGGFTSLTIRHNTVVSWDTSCIIMQTEGAAYSGLVIDNNRLLFDAAHVGSELAYGILAQVKPGDEARPASNVTITNNRIQKAQPAQSYISAHGLTNPVTISGNVDDTTGAPVSADISLMDAPEVMATTARSGAVSVVATVEGTNVTAGSADIIIKFMSY